MIKLMQRGANEADSSSMCLSNKILTNKEILSSCSQLHYIRHLVVGCYWKVINGTYNDNTNLVWCTLQCRKKENIQDKGAFEIYDQSPNIFMLNNKIFYI